VRLLSRPSREPIPWLIVELLHSGKVRDVYADGNDLILVASDRVSIYDVVLPTPIPDKGKILTALSLWWFERLAGLVPNHVISATDVPAEFAGRAIRCRKLAMVPVECVARGYLAGYGLEAYRASGAISDVPLPPGLAEGSRLPDPVFTPTTKAPPGQHDEPMTFAEVEAAVGPATAADLRRLTLDVYRRGHGIALGRGIIIADTKLEFGWAPDGTLVLADEVLTSDSSRFWPAADWQPGRPQHAFDKQVVRDWSRGLDWDRTAPGPPIPAEVVAATRDRYIEAYQRLTGTSWPPQDGRQS
jgi:phosphoribosylaminoimidazole-succinocarboxamide synthase